MAWLILPTGYSNPLIIGTSPEDPPLSSSVDRTSHFYGFEIEIMSKICTHIGAECKFKTVLSSQLLDELSSGKIDIAVSAVIIPSGNQNSQLLFSLPYLPSSAQFITKTTSSITTLKDIQGKKIGVRLGTLAHGNMFKNYVDKMYNSQVDVVSYLTMNDLLNALIDDKIDLAFSNTEPVKYWYINNSNIFKLIGKPFSIGNGYAVLGRVNEQPLFSQINQAILQIEKDGTYERIYNRYFGLDVTSQ